MLKLPDQIALRDDPERVIARPCLMLTAYLSDSVAWSRTHLSAIMRVFIDTVGAERLQLYTTTGTTDWLRVRLAEVQSLVEDARVLWWRSGVRHHFWLRLADDVAAPSVGLSYREIDTTREARCGYLQLWLPLQSASDDLLQLALAVAHTGAAHCFTAGYGYSVDAWYKPSAFTALYRASRRYLGMDIQDPDHAAWFASRGVVGCNWLTAVSDDVLAHNKLARAELASAPSTHGVKVFDLPGLLVMRAGERPDVGDRNTLQFPEAYAVVARLLAPAFVSGLEYCGAFLENEATNAWLHRFDQPQD